MWLSSRQNLSSNIRFDARPEAVVYDRFLLDLADAFASELQFYLISLFTKTSNI